MKKEQLYKIINDICVFKNPNNFNDYHKKIFKKKMNFQKIIFMFPKTNIDLNFNKKGQFLEDINVNYVQQNPKKIINKGKKNIKKNKNHKRERDYIILIDDDDNDIIDDKKNLKENL